MPFEEIEVTEAQLLQQQRSASFGARTAERIRATESCLFSLLPHDELSRRAAGWYEACTQGMLRGNYRQLANGLGRSCSRRRAKASSEKISYNYCKFAGAPRSEHLLKITYPFWTDFNGINPEYTAKVVRVDCLKDGASGIAVEFMQSLGRKAD